MSNEESTRQEKVGIAIVGLGFMGRTHLGAYGSAGSDCRLTGVFDVDQSRLGGEAAQGGNLDTAVNQAERLFDPDTVFATYSLDRLLARQDVDAVSVCTPTDTHFEVALAAIRAGKHALIEKPVSLHVAQISELAEAAEQAGVICMPAMCMRFWPEWVWLKDRVASGDAIRSISLERIGTAPGWGGGFYQDQDRSGGALYDLHIHDTDFVCHLLGTPEAVTTVGDRARMSTVYHYGDRGPRHVVASGGWLRGGADFRMRYLAEFSDGTADFDLLREPPLLQSGADSDGASAPVVVPGHTGYEGEIRAFLDAIATATPPPVTLADAAATLAVLGAEARSLETGTREPVHIV